MKKRLSISIILFILTFPLFSIDDIQLHLKVVSLEQAIKPEFYFGQILFTVKPEENTRHVGIAFAHEDYQRIHSFQKNDKGLFFLLLDIPEENYLDYRLIVDGIWQVDPVAEQQISGINGIPFSRLNIPVQHRVLSETPMVQENGLVTFTYKNQPGQSVYLAGDFNQWDPYMIPMREIKQGVYQVKVRMPSGRNFYNFFVNGESTVDPENREIQLNQYGEELSVLYIP